MLEVNHKWDVDGEPTEWFLEKDGKTFYIDYISSIDCYELSVDYVVVYRSDNLQDCENAICLY